MQRKLRWLYERFIKKDITAYVISRLIERVRTKRRETWHILMQKENDKSVEIVLNVTVMHGFAH
jgi:hypothetical protein